MEIKVGRWQLLGASTGLLLVFFYSACSQLHWGDLVAFGVDSKSTGHAFSTNPGRPQLKSGPSQEEVEAILLKVEPEFQEQCRNILEGKPNPSRRFIKTGSCTITYSPTSPMAKGFTLTSARTTRSRTPTRSSLTNAWGGKVCAGSQIQRRLRHLPIARARLFPITCT